MGSQKKLDGKPAGRAAQDRQAALLAAAVVSYATGIAVDAIVAPGRGGHGSATARQIAMYLSHIAFSLSLARVANAFGRDRSTVAYACHQTELLRDDPALDAWLDMLEGTLNAAPPSGAPQVLRLAR
jgi:chromosomal replication initiation ATPase DnaA